MTAAAARLGLAAFALLLAAGRPVRAETRYELATEELAPFSMQEGDLVTGLATDIVRAAFARAGLAADIRLYPWLRAYQLALEKPQGCVFSTTRTPEREFLFKWVGPIVKDDWVVFVPADSPIKAQSIEDLQRYKTASTPGDALAAYLTDHGIEVAFTPTNGQIQMLVSGRIDFWATTLARGAYLAHQQGVKLKPILTLRSSEMFLACNRQIEDGVIERLNEAVRSLEESGASSRFAASYR